MRGGVVAASNTNNVKVSKIDEIKSTISNLSRLFEQYEQELHNQKTCDSGQQAFIAKGKEVLVQKIKEVKREILNFLPPKEYIETMQNKKLSRKERNEAMVRIHRWIADRNGARSINSVGGVISKLCGIIDTFFMIYGRDTIRKMLNITEILPANNEREYLQQQDAIAKREELTEVVELVHTWQMVSECYMDVEDANSGVDGFVSGGRWEECWRVDGRGALQGLVKHAGSCLSQIMFENCLLCRLR